MIDSIPKDADKEAMLDKILAQLFEHYDTVQILCTVSDASGTKSVVRGIGNFYARDAVCREWVTENEEMVRTNARNRQNEAD